MWSVLSFATLRRRAPRCWLLWVLAADRGLLPAVEPSFWLFPAWGRGRAVVAGIGPRLGYPLLVCPESSRLWDRRNRNFRLVCRAPLCTALPFRHRAGCVGWIGLFRILRFVAPWRKRRICRLRLHTPCARLPSRLSRRVLRRLLLRGSRGAYLLVALDSAFADLTRYEIVLFYPGWMGSLDHVCGTTMPTVDPEQTITWKVGTTEWRELLERHIQICMRYWSFFRESKLQQKSPYNSWRQVGYVKLRGGRWFNGRRKSNHFKTN